MGRRFGRGEQGRSVGATLTPPLAAATNRRPRNGRTASVKLHLIGICGTGMGSLAGLLKAAGHDVRGSDEHVYPPMSTQLQAQAIPIFDGFGPANLDWGPEQVVVGNVCRADHVEVVEAQRRGLKLTSFPAVLEELFLSRAVPLVVAGTHGKTTTSSVAAAVLLWAGRDPGF